MTYDNLYTFSATEVYAMKYDNLWRGQINTSQIASKNATQKYKLHATGEANTTGRVYISLPADLKITDNVKAQYNIL